MSAEIIPTIPYALALFGYATAILVVSLNKITDWPKCTSEKDTVVIRKSIAFVVLVFGSIDQLIVSILLFLEYPENTLQATTFGIFGILWLLVFLFDYLKLDNRVLAPIFLIFALYTAIAGCLFYIDGYAITAALMWSAAFLNLMFTSLDAKGYPKKLTGAVGIENAAIAYYLVFALLITSQFGVPISL